MPINKLGFGIKLSTLDSGLNIITKEFPGNLAWAGLIVRDGSAYNQPGEVGISHLLEHCIFDGVRTDAVTEQLPLTSDHQINWLTESEGATLNGLNSYQSLTYVLDFNKRDLSLMLNLLLRLVLLPKLHEDSVRYQKNVVCAELARDMENPLMGDTDSTYMDEVLRSHLFSFNPIRNPQGGIMEDVKRLTTRKVRKSFSTFYAPNNMALVVLGQFSHREIVALVQKFEENFGHMLPPKIDEIPRISAEQLQEKRLVKRTEKWISDHFKHAVINMGYRAPNILHRDYIPIKILNGILGAFSFSRLYKTFREERGHSYFAESRYFRTTLHGEFVVHANLHPKSGEKIKDVVAKAEEFVVKQLKGFKKGDVSKEEFEQAKKALYNHDRKFGLESPEYVRDLVVNAFSSNQFFDGTSISDSIRQELDSALRVKNCSFRRFVSAVNRQIDPERYVLLLSGPPECV